MGLFVIISIVLPGQSETKKMKKETLPPRGTGHAPETEKKLTWKFKELPTASEVAQLVETGVIKPEEARDILFKEEVKQSDEVEALKEMVNTLQEMVKDLLARPNVTQIVPFTRVVEVPRRLNPYWEKYWVGDNVRMSGTTGDQYKTNYTLSIG